MNLLTRQRLKEVKWKDLVKMNRADILNENTITLPWLAASLVLSYFRLYIIAMPFSFLFFLTGLRQVHNGCHHNLGVNKFLNWLSLFLNSVLMLTAMHAIRYNHLLHHKHCLSEKDVEGSCARMSWWKALLYGPVFIFKIHGSALRSGNKQLVNNVLIELFSVSIFVTLILLFNVKFLVYHLIVMLAGEFASGFFAVWTVHHDCDEEIFARTVSKRWKNVFTYNMFYHLEHHLFPKVPTKKLPELSRRIRETFPDLDVKEVF